MILLENTRKNLIKEFEYSASRSSGPGGQNVNKVNSKIEVRFNISLSAVLTGEQKQLLLSRLDKRLNASGELVVTSQEDRSQIRNKEIATDKLLNLLIKTSIPEKKRKKTRPTKSSIEKRLENKKHRSLIKQTRRTTDY